MEVAFRVLRQLLRSVPEVLTTSDRKSVRKTVAQNNTGGDISIMESAESLKVATSYHLQKAGKGFDLSMVVKGKMDDQIY